MYPKGVVEFVASNPELRGRFADVVEGTTGGTGAGFETWLVGEGARRSDEVRRFVMFLGSMLSIFSAIERRFPRDNDLSQDAKDRAARQTTVEEMLVIARVLYVLDSHGVRGDVLECGCFKGFSSCCLSWACDVLGRRLIVADSFEGLPAQEENPYYRKGEFKGAFDEVQRNLRDLGRLERVDFVRGFFSDSLPGFARPLALLWLDVDLHDSARDVMVHAFGSLDPAGVIVSNELVPEYFQNERLMPVHGPAKAIAEFLASRGIEQSAVYTTETTGLILPRRSGPMPFSMTKHDSLMAALRADVERNVRQWRRRALFARVRRSADRAARVPVLGPLVSATRTLARRALLSR